MAERIGQGSCPVCASPKARYTLSKKQLICVTCDACNVQIFARSDRSDQLLRVLVKPDQAKTETPGIDPTSTRTSPDPESVVAPAVEVKNTLPADPPPATPPAPPRRRSLMEW